MLTESQQHRAEANRRRAIGIRASRCMLVGRCYRHPHLSLSTDTPLKMIKEPTNAHDANACMVWAKIEDEWLHIGYVERAIAKLLATVDVTIVRVLIGGVGDLPIEVRVVV